MRLIPRSLRALVIASTTAFVVATVGTGIAVYLVTKATIRHIVDERLAATSEVVTDGPNVSAKEMLRRINAMAGDRDTGDIGFALLDAQGRWLGGSVALFHRPPDGFSTIDTRESIPGLTKGRALVRRVGDVRLVIVAETEPFDDYDTTRLNIYLIGFGSILLTVLGGLLAFGYIVRRRIAESREIAEAIIDGDMARRVPFDGSNGVFDKQARTFNRMLDRIQALMAGLESVSNDVAHDLRTPLARLRSELDLLAKDPRAAPVREEIEAAVDQSDDLLALFGAILKIAEIEGGNHRSAFAPVDLAEVAAQVIETMQAVAEEDGHVLTEGRLAPAFVLGDHRILAQVLFNLVGNAIRHTPPGTEIRVDTRLVREQAVITVTDNGPGIPAESRGEAMRRFGRLDPSRHGSGHGLGLAMAEAAMRLHSGEIALDDAKPGLRVVLRMPVRPPVRG